MRPPPAAWNILQSGHCASEGRQSTSAFPLDESFEGFTNQRRFLRYPSKLLGDAYEIVIQRNCCSHRELQAPIIASNDVTLCAYNLHRNPAIANPLFSVFCAEQRVSLANLAPKMV